MYKVGDVVEQSWHSQWWPEKYPTGIIINVSLNSHNNSIYHIKFPSTINYIKLWLSDDDINCTLSEDEAVEWILKHG